MTRPVRARIDLHALQSNLRRVRALAPGSRVMAVVKADAYGHGLVMAARALESADGFATASLDEARVLREAGIRLPILLLEGVFEARELDAAVLHGIELVVHHEHQLAMLEKASPVAPLKVWLKLDTGMHRLGFSPAELGAILKRLNACRHISRPVGLISHLARADERDSDMTREQLSLFSRALDGLPGPRSLANSAGILAWPETHLDWVRPGIMLYGSSPFADQDAASLDLKPVMTLSTKLIAIHHFEQGDAVGYGGDWTCPEAMPVGVAAIGYGDGYPRHAPAGTPVLVNGQRVPLIGRVSMDMITLDLREQPNAKVDDPVILWGQGLSVDEIARCAGSISYELLCGVTARVPRVLAGPSVD